ncbi:MAG: deoxyguanosinetriphosphate triphosphohydrolase [Alphaproteobacteria bacterium]|nr:deoxyguanosinetriphosphate triphosphohydrolase [Alphaproteobacteria bacterium]
MHDLAPFATQSSRSRGRLITEAPSPTRGPYQRDRDRIIHSSAFRRLRNKTQVFIESEGDYFRTRLTHSLEVAQIARAIARILNVDEDLAEAMALAHDLGHTCFGHAGEKALNQCMLPYGGFNHNDQTFRLLTLLEKKYAAFDGLNLTWEMLEGVVKHNGPLAPEKTPTTIKAFQSIWNLELQTFAGIEAQIAALADDIAYNTHDFDDGFNAGFFAMDELEALPIFDSIVRDTRSRYPKIEARRLIHEIVREAIGVMVADLLVETKTRLAKLKPQSAEDIRAASVPMVAFSESVESNLGDLRHFLHQHMYRAEKVKIMTDRAAKLVTALFDSFFNNPALLPVTWVQRFSDKTTLEELPSRARMVADYIAGMTDRFAEQEYKRLFLNDNL